MPQTPLQPSGPHCLPTQVGWQTHTPAGLQLSEAGQVPQVPPHPSGPHSLPTHEGVQLVTQVPLTVLHSWP